MEALNHQCMIYTGSPTMHLRGLATLAKGRLSANWRCLYLNSPAVVAEMRSQMRVVGVAVGREEQRGALILSSDQGHLKDGRFDVDRMLAMLEDAIREALRDGYVGLWATGDMSWEFGNEKDFSRLLEYEYALERLFEREPALSGICQYHTETLPTDAVNWGLLSHQGLYINEAVSRPNPYYEPANLLTHPRPVVPRQKFQELLASPLYSLESYPQPAHVL